MELQPRPPRACPTQTVLVPAQRAAPSQPTRLGGTGPGLEAGGCIADSPGTVLGAPQRDRQVPARAAEPAVQEAAGATGRSSGFKGEPSWEVQADNPHRRGHRFSTRATPLLKPAHCTALSGEQARPRRWQRHPCGRGASTDRGASKGGHESARLG